MFFHNLENRCHLFQCCLAWELLFLFCQLQFLQHLTVKRSLIWTNICLTPDLHNTFRISLYLCFSTPASLRCVDFKNSPVTLSWAIFHLQELVSSSNSSTEVKPLQFCRVILHYFNQMNKGLKSSPPLFLLRLLKCQTITTVTTIHIFVDSWV